MSFDYEVSFINTNAKNNILQIVCWTNACDHVEYRGHHSFRRYGTIASGETCDVFRSANSVKTSL